MKFLQFISVCTEVIYGSATLNKQPTKQVIALKNLLQKAT